MIVRSGIWTHASIWRPERSPSCVLRGELINTNWDFPIELKEGRYFSFLTVFRHCRTIKKGSVLCESKPTGQIFNRTLTLFLKLSLIEILWCHHNIFHYYLQRYQREILVNSNLIIMSPFLKKLRLLSSTWLSGVGFEPTPPFGDQNAHPVVYWEGNYP